MRLVEWRKWQGLTQEELAKLLRRKQPTVSAIERWPNNSIPSPALMLSIYRVTSGAVTPDSFYNLPVLEQLPLPMEDRKPRAVAPAPLLDGCVQPGVDTVEPEVAEAPPALRVAA